MIARWLGIFLTVWVAAGLLTPMAGAATYTVSGTIHTPTGGNALANDVPVKHIRVIVMDSDVLFDDIAGTAHTDGSGNFSVTFTDDVEAPDIFINVEYVGTAADGQFVEVRLNRNDASPIREEDIEGMIHPDIPAGALALGVLHLGDTRANIITHVGDAIKFLRANSNAWMMTDNVNAEGRTTNGASFVAGDGSFMSIAMEDYDMPSAQGRPNAAISDLHHETFHWVAHRAYGGRFPSPSCQVQGGHSSNTQSCEGFAMAEGSAQWFGVSSAPPDQKTTPPSPTDWRGADGTGVDNSGEIVEGAYEATWNQISDLAGTLQVLLTDAPDSIREFRDAYAIDKGWSSQAMITFLDSASNNGIVYTRGKFNGFAEGDPPNTAPPSSGNFKILSDVAFLRGKTKPAVLQLTQAELRLASTNSVVNAGRKDLGFKTASNGLLDSNIANFTYAGAVAFNSDLEWDTSQVSDGDYDLVIRLESNQQWVDTFLPDFMGDTTMAVNSFEKWLKTRGTWYNQDNMPDNDKEGKVVVDNAPPKVKDFKPN